MAENIVNRKRANWRTMHRDLHWELQSGPSSGFQVGQTEGKGSHASGPRVKPRLVGSMLVKMIDALGVKQRRAALDSMHVVSGIKQKLGQIRAILPDHFSN